ncbi:MAG: 2-oxoacid:acceptor oxidoreductase family protein [Rhodocyclaceae bacterium]|nr:2-oxoacid:acceptor oxidoreductase family protein [Rhodocyclaceae bacterium]
MNEFPLYFAAPDRRTLMDMTHMKAKSTPSAKYSGIPTVINGNGAVAQVMGHVCGGVIGYPITPSTEISEIYEAFRADGGMNVWGKHPFFFIPEGEHSAQSGALGAALTGGKYISNASSSQGILYGLESHYVTAGKKTGGFVLHVAARVVSKHSLNVMAGHDDVYALISSGYTILFGSNPQEAADLAAISYRVASLSLIPVANAMDGFSTSHMMSEAQMPEPALLREYLGDPTDRITCPSVAQDILFGAKGRVAQLGMYLSAREADFSPEKLKKLNEWLKTNAAQVEQDNAGEKIDKTLAWIPEELQGQWARQWKNAHEVGTRQRVPALVDIHNPGLTGAVQNQPDFQAGAADHRTHFVAEVPRFVRQAMEEYALMTGRTYSPVQTFQCEDADDVMVCLGSVTDDAEAVAEHLRGQGKKVGVISIKLLTPFPEAEFIAAVAGKRAITVMERSDQLALTAAVRQALAKAIENSGKNKPHAAIPALSTLPKIVTAIFGLGGHDLQPRHLVAAFKNMEKEASAPFVYLGSQFFSKTTDPRMTEIQARLKAAYPETELMALEAGVNPDLLPKGAFRVRFHSVGGYGTIASGKLLTDILSGALNLHSKAAPKYGSEKSGAPTNYYITLSPELVKITNADLEDVEVVLSPDHKVFSHTNPLRGLAVGGTFILQTSDSAEVVWRSLPDAAKKTIRERKIRFFVIDAFAVAKKHAPTADLETRMMGIAFIGAVAGHVEQVTKGASLESMLEKIESQIAKKFGGKGGAVVKGNMAVIREGVEATQRVNYDAFANTPITSSGTLTSAISASVCQAGSGSACAGFYDRDYYDKMIATPFREGTISEAPVLPGSGCFMPAGCASIKDKGLFRRSVPEFLAPLCTGCMECAMVCPDAAIPNLVHDIHALLLTAIAKLEVTEIQKDALRNLVPPLSETVREKMRQGKSDRAFHEIVADAVVSMNGVSATVAKNLASLPAVLATYPVAQTRPFFDAAEKATAGTGGLFAAIIDPWKCTGCLECVAVCGPGALVARNQDAALSDALQNRFEFSSQLPDTPVRFTQGATQPGGDIKRLLLSRPNYYATTGGHGACRGCGEVTAVRMIMATNKAIHENRRNEHVKALEDMLATLEVKLQEAASIDDTPRQARITATIAQLNQRLYQFESGPSGKGPAAAVIANSTGCSSVYASTFPFNMYNDPWVNSLFQDAQPLAKGIYEGLAASAIDDARALRVAYLEMNNEYVPAMHDKALALLTPDQFTTEEIGLMPTVMTIGGDGATYDIGFGAFSRLLTTDTPVKVLVLNTGAYSNTGGQVSTASLSGQDADLSRHGKLHGGKQEARKELGLIAAFHPRVLVAQLNTALTSHFLKNTATFLTRTDGPAVLDVYTSCQPEHGVTDDAANRQALLAVNSRMSPVFVHDPHAGCSLKERFSLEGNPDIDKTWTTTTLEYFENGQLQLKEIPLTTASFAVTEGRFKKHFSKLAEDADALSIDAYVDLAQAARKGKTPFVWSTKEGKLIRLEVSQTMVGLVEERRRNWRMLQELSGQTMVQHDAAHGAEIAALRSQYQTALASREDSIDAIARTMSQLAASSKAPASGGGFPVAVVAAPATRLAAAASTAIVSMTDETLCTDCKTCYQELPGLFEKTKIVVDGKPKEIAHLIPGAVDKVTLTPELKAKIAKVIANCDAEIIV